MHSHNACSRYKDIPGFPVSTVEGHSGRLLFGKVSFVVSFVFCVLWRVACGLWLVACGLWLVVCGALPYCVLLTCLPCVRRGTHPSALCPAWCIFLFWWMPTPWIDKPSGIVLAYSRSNVLIGSTSPVCTIRLQLRGKTIGCMQGRFHSYEGYPMWKVTLPVRVMSLMGAKVMIATNAAGGLNRAYKVGDIMIMHDHINFPGMAGRHPLVGPNIKEFGPRFNPMYVAAGFAFFFGLCLLLHRSLSFFAPSNGTLLRLLLVHSFRTAAPHPHPFCTCSIPIVC